MSLERFRAIESEMKRGAFALVDEEDALSKAKRDPSKSLVPPLGSWWSASSEQKQYGWTGQQSSSGFFDRPPATPGVFASLDRF
jgi:hypothetical protein